MNIIKVEMITIFENSEEKTETIDSNFTDIDKAVEYFLEFDTSKFPSDANRIRFNLYEIEYPHIVTFSKFKDEWYGSEYRFSFKGYYLNELLFSVDGDEVEIADYLFKNIDKINIKFNLALDAESFKTKIEPDDFVIEELIDGMNTNEAKFEFLDI